MVLQLQLFPPPMLWHFDEGVHSYAHVFWTDDFFLLLLLFFTHKENYYKYHNILLFFYEKNASVKILLNISVHVPGNKENYTGLEIR